MSQDTTQVRILLADGTIAVHKVPNAIAEAARKLPYDPKRYFEAEQGCAINVENLVQSRARTQGIENAVQLMAAAYAGSQTRRAPISVRLLDEERFLVVDGNSTVTIAIAAGWPDVPCIVLE